MKKFLLISVIIILFLCCTFNIFVFHGTVLLTDNLLSENEALAVGETATVYENHTIYMSDRCSVTITNEDGTETILPGTFAYCHEMPYAHCLMGCAL